ncbi:hypothetical protein ANABIO32_02260 [Rossellomorea marisflavi]|uniref:hypothetical protein n=1 Tax=Rossellomorea marisflavi TaxID=189381 RepID=UPI0025CA024B|nr:hypothetical protein [Rossellomorea marisflavi]GLI82539.1 hypothetical protein ANABIO32_02260 [Rossellomorea marisflavi]
MIHIYIFQYEWSKECNVKKGYVNAADEEQAEEMVWREYGSGDSIEIFYCMSEYQFQELIQNHICLTRVED